MSAVTSQDELGQMSAAFNRMTSTLETQRDLRRRLINDVSHELNTPLSVIKLEAQGLRDGLQQPGTAADHIITWTWAMRRGGRIKKWTGCVVSQPTLTGLRRLTTVS